MNINLKSPTFELIANCTLLVSCLALNVFMPLFPKATHSFVSRVAISFIFTASIFLLLKVKWIYIFTTLTFIAIEWLTLYFDSGILLDVFKIASMLFFCWIVFTLLFKISRAKVTTPSTILEAVNGYLLLGILYTILITIIIKYDPGAIIKSSNSVPLFFEGILNYECLYYTFITFTTVGYGDYTAASDVAKSVSVLIGMSGQLYLSIIVALIISKVSILKRT